MKIIKETALENFEFWSGACTLAEALTLDEFRIIEEVLEDESTFEHWTETMINDLFWFDSDWVVQLIGYDDFDEFYEKRCK